MSSRSEPPVRILLIEDDEDDVVLTRDLLRQAGPDRFQLDWTDDYADGLGRLCDGDGYDICLVDYRLGDQSGIDLLREAIDRRCRVPVILLTGQGGHEVDVAAMQAGAADFLSKSQITADLLERSIRYAIQNRRAEEQRIRLLREQAARSEAEASNRAKDQFLSVLSHELRTPLSPVLMAVGVIDSDPGFPEHLREYLDIIRQSVELESRLIDDLLDLTRISRGRLDLHFEVVNLHGTLEHAIRTVKSEPDRDQLLLIEPEADEHHVWADPGRIQQVFLNLLRNAVKFTPAGGRIKVITSNPSPGRIMVRVADTGIGIDPKVLPRIFDAFQQGDPGITRQFGGLGLGLAIARMLVEKHNGRLSAESAGLQKGAAFTVELSTIAAPVPERPGMPAGQRNVSVLLVEDHVETSRLMARLLRSFRYEVETAANVADAKRLADRHEFDVVLSDIGLPDGSGLDLMRHLRQRHGLRGIAVSGYGLEEDRERSLEAGFAEHLIKPVDFRTLRSAIDRLVANLPE